MKKNKRFLQWIYSYLIILLLTFSFPLFAYYQSIKTINEVSLFGHDASVNQLKLTTDALLEDIADLVGNMSIYLEPSMLSKIIYNADYDDMLFKFRIQDLLHSQQMTKPEIEIHVVSGDNIISKGSTYTEEEFFKIKLKETGLSLENWNNIVAGKVDNLYMPMTLLNSVGRQVNYIALFKKNPIFNTGDFGISCYIILIKEEAILSNIKNNNWMLLGNTCIVDKFGRPLFTTNDSHLDEQIISRLQNNEVPVSDGNIYLTKKSANRDWFYISYYPEELFKEQSIKIQHLAIIMSVMVIVLGILAAYFLTRRNYKPLEKLVVFFEKNIAVNSESRTGEYAYIREAATRLISEKDSIQEKLKRQQIMNRRSFLSTLLRGKITGEEEEIFELLQKRKIFFKWTGFCVLLFQIDEADHDDQKLLDIEESAKLLDIVILDIIDKHFSNSYLYTEIGDFPAVILDVSGENLSYQDRLEEMRTELSEKTALRYTVGVSAEHDNVAALFIAQTESREALEYSLLLGRDRVILFDEFQTGRELRNYTFNLGTEMRFINSIRLGDYDQAGKVLNSAIKNIQKKNNVSMASLQARISGIVSLMIAGFGEISFDIDNDRLDELNPTGRILQSKSIDEIQNESNYIFNQLEHLSKEQQKNKISNLVSKVDHILDERVFDPDLSVGELADRLDMAVPTLSLTFKQQANCGLLDYIHKRRIDYAKSMIRQDSEIRLKEIALKTGYRSDISFNRVFKRYEGMTPGQYKKLYGP